MICYHVFSLCDCICYEKIPHITHLIKQPHLHKAGQCVEFKLALAHTDGQIWKIQFNMSGEKNVIVFYFT